ncbi:glutathione S-transferase family protein [Massilia antarctica]|uniref:glutathione S-transferase family protein n=1 Tax=Massilia antarctica TaxID=2765360 RepID=UPI0006BB5BEC|nr:glutathione S-transferase [Massilia sp. H27-R4]MCY0915135.1 glutathione S-transferase [Massilia sp. H27-R4]CUI07115.1 Glutathione S-transferase, unnamed subgroup [Janthinobacterium sp. CG23_2]CUU30901.1 Glutathione S-transferase, unnamed subgroup [Janthinobacterium sp. CG23_2]
MQTTSLILHGLTVSGHVHRVELLLRMLDLPFTFVPAPADVRASAAFRALNPLGQIPVLQDGELVINDSNAILVYLAKRYAPGSDWLPEDPLGAAAVQRWLSIAAGELAFGPAKARANALWEVPADLVQAGAVAQRLLAFMEQHLGTRRFLAAEHVTVADLACYSYVAHAPEGGIALAPYPALRAWLARIEALPGFVALPASPLPAAA